jgi:GAF domain-containing protein
MGGSDTEHPAQAVAELELLLRQLRWCASADEAETLIADRLVELTGADRALLYLVSPLGVQCAADAGGEIRALAAATLAGGYARGGFVDGWSALAMPLATVSAPVGVLVLLHGRGDALGERQLALVRLFAEHAGAALRRLMLPITA